MDPGDEDWQDDQLGDGLVNADFAATGLFVATAAIGVLLPGTFFGPLSAIVAGVLFTVGVAAFLWAYAVAVSRSRDDLIGIGGLFFLAGTTPRTAPKQVRFRMRLALIIQIVVAFAAAAARPYTIAAFGVLAPVFGLGLMGLWGARHGRFAPRPTAGADAPAVDEPAGSE